MDASEQNLLAQTDEMTESMLVRMEDWELAHLRLAMLHQVEQALTETLTDSRDATQGPSYLDRVWVSHRTENRR